MTNVDSPTTNSYQPTPAQLERAAALRRFNWLYLYGPLLLGSLIIVTLLVLMIIFGVVQNDVRQLLSAVADIILIVLLVPAVLSSLLVPVAFAYFYVEGRKNGNAPLQRLQTLLWRLETLIRRLSARWRELAPRLARPVITLNVYFKPVEQAARRLLSGDRRAQTPSRDR